MLSVVVDLQGFKTERNTFVAKEIAIFANNRDAETDFAGPFDGWIPYHRLPEILDRELATVDAVFVKGLEKKTWLSQVFLRTDIDIVDIVKMYEKKKNDNDSDDDSDDDYNDNEDNTEGFDVDDDYCGIVYPVTDVPNLKSMSAKNVVRCPFHNGGGRVCALENIQKIHQFMRSEI